VATRCVRCGVLTDTPEAFFAQRRGFRRAIVRYCPACWLRGQRRQLHSVLLWNLAFVAVGLALVLGPQRNPAGWLLLNISLLQLCFLLTMLPHELGHAWMGRWLGLRVFGIRVGYGPVLFVRRLLGFEVELRTIPVVGFTLVAHPDGVWFRAKRIALLLAGPLVNLGLVAVVYLLVPSARWGVHALVRGVLPLETFAYANLVVVAVNLWPRRIDTPMGPQGSDGMQLWETLFLGPADVDRHQAWWFALEGAACRERGERQAALAWLERGLARYPDAAAVLSWHGIVALDVCDYRAARVSFVALLAHPDLKPAGRPLVLSNIAYTDALIGGELLDEADRYSCEALASLGWMSAVRGTRGAVLVALGRLDEGIDLLRDSMREAERPGDKALDACFLAIGEARRGNRTAAESFLEEARRLDRSCPLLERAEGVLSPAGRAAHRRS